MFITEKEILEKYPKIFKQKDLDMTKTCMCWGIETGPGWMPLIDSLCAFIQFNTDENGYPQIEAVQVKEKMGGLRFYVTYKEKSLKELKKKHPYMNNLRDSEFLDGAISFAESISYTICETCGNSGKDTGESWIVTLCDVCKEKRKKERKDEEEKYKLEFHNKNKAV